MPRIAVDAMGGDRGPADIVAGALEGSRHGIDVVLYGPQTLETQGLELVVADEVIEMDEKPADAVRSKPDSSLVAACRAVGEGDADAVVSAGNTGAMLAASHVVAHRSPCRVLHRDALELRALAQRGVFLVGQPQRHRHDVMVPN